MNAPLCGLYLFLIVLEASFLGFSYLTKSICMEIPMKIIENLNFKFNNIIRNSYLFLGAQTASQAKSR